MKILHTVNGFTSSGGGITTCLYELLTILNQTGIHTDLLSTSGITGEIYGNGEKWIHSYRFDHRTPIGFSHNLKHELKKAEEYDLYHINGLWTYSNHITAAIARQKKKPYIITPHGMLYPEALKRRYWKKWPLLKLWFNSDIHNAAAIHATCNQEAEAIRQFGYKGRIEVIPNVLILPEFTSEIFSNRRPCDSAPRKIGFLGRLHPRKGIDYLINALALAQDKEIQFIIMGEGEPKYVESLKQLSTKLGVENRITFAGFLNGREKYEKLAQIAALMVPSDMENFGMIVPEALSVGTPVMASLRTPWKILNQEHCGWWTDRNIENLSRIIDEIATLPSSELLEMGRRGREMIMHEFSPSRTATLMNNLYTSII